MSLQRAAALTATLVLALSIPGCRSAPADTRTNDACAAPNEVHAAPTRTGDAPKAEPAGARFRFVQRAGPSGAIPPDALWRAKLQRDAMLGTAPANGGGRGPTSWEWLGPGNVGGRLRAILIHPTRSDTIWVGAAGGGVWKTTDRGRSWSPQDDYPASLAIGCMAMDPSDPDRIYVGTGEGFFDAEEGSSNTAAIRGAGIFVTTNGGISWTKLFGTATPDWSFVNRIAIDPTDPRVILAATGAGIFRSTDRGTTWSRRTTARTLDLKIDPGDPRKLVAGRADGVAQYSTDAGVTWSNASGISGAGRIELAYAPSNPSIVYANATLPSRGIVVFRSTDGGQSYLLRTRGTPIPTWSTYASAIWVHPTDSSRIVFAGIEVYNSTDGGRNYNRIQRGLHVDFHVFVEDPGFGTSNSRLYAANDGGINYSPDPFAPLAVWRQLNNNLGVTQFYGAAVHRISGVVVGGTQDRGILQFSGDPQGWVRGEAGDGGFCASDPTDPNVFYSELQGLRVMRSRDAGRSFCSIYTGGSNPIREPRANFIAPLTLDPNDPNRMFAGGEQLWRSDNVKSGNPPRWFSIKPRLSCQQTSAHFQDNPPCNISAIAVTPGSSDAVWVGHNSGHLFKTANATSASPIWVRVDDTSPALPDRWVSRIAIDPFNPNRVYVAFMGYDSDNVWLTLDGGTTWRSVSGNTPNRLPDIPVSTLVVHPRVRGLLFAGTDLGVFWSYDDGASWQTAGDGPGLVAIDDLIWQDERRLLVATHGRGVHKATVNPASVHVVGTGCGVNDAPTLTVDAPIVGRTQQYRVAAAAPNAPAWILFSPGPAFSMPVGNGCVLQITPGFEVAFAIGTTDAQGAAGLSLSIRSDSELIGALLTTQVFIARSGGPFLNVGEATHGVELTVGL